MKVKEISDFLGNGEILTVEKGIGNHNLVFSLSNINVKCIRTKVVLSKEEVEYANFDLMNTLFTMLRSGMNDIYDSVNDAGICGRCGIAIGPDDSFSKLHGVTVCFSCTYSNRTNHPGER